MKTAAPQERTDDADLAYLHAQETEAENLALRVNRLEAEIARLRELLVEVRELPEFDDEKGYCLAGCPARDLRRSRHRPDCLWRRIDLALAETHAQ